jgi:hypothetical protein
VFTKWLIERRERRAARRYQAGYDWAAGALLRGAPETEIEMHLDNPFDSNEFESGGNAAVRDFARLKAKGRSKTE